MKVTLKDFYLNYPFKCYGGNTRVYIKQEDERCNEHYSLNYKEYKTIMNTYFKYIILYLRSGLVYRLPKHLGRLYIGTYKGGYYDYNDKAFYRNEYKFRKKFILKWDKNYKFTKFSNKAYWKAKFTKTSWSFINDWIEKLPSRIKNYTEL